MTTEDLLEGFSDIHSFIGDMTKEQRAALLAIATPRTLANKQVVSEQGKPSGGVYLIVTGGIRMESYSRDGDRFLVGDLQSGDVFGLMSTLDQQPLLHFVTAVGETETVFLPADRFRQIVFSDPVLSRQLIELMCKRLRMALIMAGRFAPGSQPVRVIRCLVSLADHLGYHPAERNRVNLTISQFDIASMLSVSRQSVNRVLKDLEAEGLIKVGYNMIEVTDLARLRLKLEG